MKRTIDPRKIVLTTMKKECPDCHSIQHCFFTDQKQFDEWDCPICNGRIEAHEDFVAPNTEGDDGSQADKEEVPVVAEDIQTEQENKSA